MDKHSCQKCVMRQRKSFVELRIAVQKEPLEMTILILAQHYKTLQTKLGSLQKLHYHVRYLSTLLYKQDPATEFIKLRSTPFKDGATLAPKLADPLSFGEAAPPPLNTGSSILDLDGLIFCTILTCQLDEIHYLESRSHRVNTSFGLAYPNILAWNPRIVLFFEARLLA